MTAAIQANLPLQAPSRIGVPAADGSPPYIIKWLKDGHIAMVQPDQYARIIPAVRPCQSNGKREEAV
jgi:hypothetical protein